MFSFKGHYQADDDGDDDNGDDDDGDDDDDEDFDDAREVTLSGGGERQGSQSLRQKARVNFEAYLFLDIFSFCLYFLCSLFQEEPEAFLGNFHKEKQSSPVSFFR